MTFLGTVFCTPTSRPACAILLAVGSLLAARRLLIELKAPFVKPVANSKAFFCLIVTGLATIPDSLQSFKSFL